MEINEIKKELYKQKPKADLINVTKSGLLYSTIIQTPVAGNGTLVRHTAIRFLVPLSEIGDAIFGPSGVESQLLNRYIVPHKDVTT